MKGSPEQLRVAALRRRHPAGVKEPVVPPSQAAIRDAIAAQLCPFCGRGPFRMLPVHTNKTHGVDKWKLRDLAGLSTSDPLCSDEARAAMSAAYDPSRGAQLRATAGARARRPQRWTQAGRARNIATIQRQNESPESPEWRAKALVRAHAPDAQARRSATLRQKWSEASDADRQAVAARLARSPAELSAQSIAMWDQRGRQPCGTVASYKRGCRCGDCRAAKAASR